MLIPIDTNVKCHQKNNILICLCVKMTRIRKQQTPENYNKYDYCLNQFAFIWYFFHGCSFYRFAAIIFAKILENHCLKWRYQKVVNNFVL